MDIAKANTMFTRQVVQLRLITSRLQSAYNGEDVDWIDTGGGGRGVDRRRDGGRGGLFVCWLLNVPATS